MFIIFFFVIFLWRLQYREYLLFTCLFIEKFQVGSNAILKLTYHKIYHYTVKVCFAKYARVTLQLKVLSTH